MEVFVGDFFDRPSKFTGIIEDPNGGRVWLLVGKFHRINGPAIIYRNEHSRWFLYGEELNEEEHTKRTTGYKTTLGRLLLKEQPEIT